MNIAVPLHQYSDAPLLMKRAYRRRAGMFYLVSSGFDEIDEIQEFQDRMYAGLNEKAKGLIRPRTAADRIFIKQNGGFHFTVRDAQTDQIVGILLGSCVASPQEYEERICLRQQAGRPCQWQDKFMALSTTFIDPQYQMTGIAEALFEAALDIGAQNDFDSYGFVIGHDNRSYLKCALSLGFYIVGSGVHEKLGTKMFLFEKSVDVLPEQERVKLPMTQSIFDAIAIENYLDDEYVIVDMGLYHPSFTFARLRNAAAKSRQSA